ncbi:DUF5996 family protein [Oceanivirga miroungae]|uniref:Uncharacterized protein n=1 Tax=Oceanivirga miroungae TaxID=1130046 RepID=A0A6I8MD09_9FUSO|nr:DUF5996 family protein [Oceanivirga miroungae]VWL85382.1 hypothetical protein OMES3154_00667 [Oceanivirga miroungae]
MLLLSEWKKEKETLHHLSQILGKYKLESRFKEPQWAHVILDVNTVGFTTGILFYNDTTYEIAVNLRDDRIEVITENETEYITLEDGKSIKDYYLAIDKILLKNGIIVNINKKPQEVPDKTLFDEDIDHHHYNSEISKKFLKIMHFGLKALSKFISPYRTRKVKPGLFWGTFDISCLINYNQLQKSFDESMVIEHNAFDEHFIEFGFWFGDDNFKGPTFFILPHPFLGDDFNRNVKLPEGGYFYEPLKEFMFEFDKLDDKTAKNIVEFLRIGYKEFKTYLNWNDGGYCSIPLNIKDNEMELNCEF